MKKFHRLFWFDFYIFEDIMFLFFKKFMVFLVSLSLICWLMGLHVSYGLFGKPRFACVYRVLAGDSVGRDTACPHRTGMLLETRGTLHGYAIRLPQERDLSSAARSSISPGHITRGGRDVHDFRESSACFHHKFQLPDVVFRCWSSFLPVIKSWISLNNHSHL